MAKRRKPISFDTTLRNPERIPQFISVLSNFEGETLDNDTAILLEATIIQQKIFQPTQRTLGNYTKEYSSKFKFHAKDQSDKAFENVKKYFFEWLTQNPGETDIEKIVYLLENTITSHKESGWRGGWESRLHTQFNFLNELGLVRVVKSKKILISDTGKLMIKNYHNGYKIDDSTAEFNEQSAFLIAFSKYQTNNPYRQNTVRLNFLPLVLNLLLYVKNNYDKPGISRQDLSFVIVWGDNDFKSLGDYIFKFREKFGYRTSDELVYEYAMNLLNSESSNLKPQKASAEFIKSKQNDYKFSKITRETPDEVIRKLRLTMLISLRGGGRFIDINTNEINKVNHVVEMYSTNTNFDSEKIDYLNYMGQTDQKLIFDKHEEISSTKNNFKNKVISDWAKKNDWNFLKNETTICISNNKSSNDRILKYLEKPVRLEFLVAITLKKALPNSDVLPNYLTDDEGIPFTTAMGKSNNSVGADIDIFEDTIHAIAEPTLSNSRSFQTDHEIPSIRTHVIETVKKDKLEETKYKEWFAIFIAPTIIRDVGDTVAVVKHINNVNIYPWEILDLIEFSKEVSSIKDYQTIRSYAIPQRI